MSRFVFNVAEYGATSNDLSVNRKAIQAATDDAIDAKGAVVYFPPNGDNGRYETDGPIVIARDGDFDARIAFVGDVGRRGTRFRIANHDEPVFDFSTTGGNLRGISMRNLALYDGISAIRMDKCAYLSFENMSFMQQYGYSIDALNSYDIAFSNSWWVHLIGDTAKTINGGLFFNGCYFGEDAGLFLSMGYMQINGGAIRQANAKLTPGGYKDMGREVFTVAGGGQLHVADAHIAKVAENLVNIDNADEVTVSGCTIEAGEGALVCVRRSDQRYPVNLTGNTVRFRNDARLFRSHLLRDIAGVWMDGNTWLIDEDATVDLSVPPRPDMVDGNMLWAGAL